MIYINKRVIIVIQAELSVCNGVETGGVFLGYEAPDKNVFIVDSTFSGPGAVHEHQYFETDEQYVDYQINMLSRLYKRQLSVVGYWHSHVVFSPFSEKDDATNLSYAELNSFGAYCGIVQCERDNELQLFHIAHSTAPCEYALVD